MGILCKMFDHQNDAINFWGEECEYILFRCKRCKHEEIYCSYEGRTLPNDEMGKKILNKMMEDKQFSLACHIHDRFVMAEFNNAFKFKKQEEEFKKIQKEFDLPSSKRVPCPVEMFKAGLWIDKEEKKSKSKPKNISIDKPKSIEDLKLKGRTNKIDTDYTKDSIEGEKPLEPVGENSDFQFEGQYTNEVEPVIYNFQKSVKVPTGGETLEQLERLEKIYVENENYEKAAEIHQKIQKLKNCP
jgi:hypothetical protein